MVSAIERSQRRIDRWKGVVIRVPVFTVARYVEPPARTDPRVSDVRRVGTSLTVSVPPVPAVFRRVVEGRHHRTNAAEIDLIVGVESRPSGESRTSSS